MYYYRDLDKLPFLILSSASSPVHPEALQETARLFSLPGQSLRAQMSLLSISFSIQFVDRLLELLVVLDVESSDTSRVTERLEFSGHVLLNTCNRVEIEIRGELEKGRRDAPLGITYSSKMRKWSVQHVYERRRYEERGSENSLAPPSPRVVR